MKILIRTLFMIMCVLVISFSAASSVLASSEGSHGGGSGSHEIEEDDGHGGGGGQHGTSSVSAEDLMRPFTILWHWMVVTKINIAGFSFTFADKFIWYILASIALWFIGYKIYYD